MTLDCRHEALLPIALRADAAAVALLALRLRRTLLTGAGPGVPYFGETDCKGGLRRALSHQPLH